MAEHDQGPALPFMGVIMAGGRSRRMGREKAFIELGGKLLIERAIGRLAPQVSGVIINANGDPARFERFGLPIVADIMPGYKGPLAGILTAISEAKRRTPSASHVLTIACDTPFFPLDLAARLAATLEEADEKRKKVAAIAASPGQVQDKGKTRLHPAFGLWPLSWEETVRQNLAAGHLRLHDMVELLPCRRVVFASSCQKAGSGSIAPDPFFNLNHPRDLRQAEKLMI